VNPQRASRKPAAPQGSPFTTALAELLRSRNLDVPPGLLEAPAEAYAGAGEAAVQFLARLNDADLAQRARKVAEWEQRQADRARQAWETSPLIRELRRRRLPEPPRPPRISGVAFSVKKPLAEWTDQELQQAATEWVRLGGQAGLS
jgi:hypothetical protein